MTRAEAAVVEALHDPRIGPDHVPADEVPGTVDADLSAFTTERPIEWAAQTLTQSEILDAFADHCRADLDDVEIVEQRSGLLVARWRRETSRLELRAGLVGFERLASEHPTMLLTDLEEAAVDSLAERFAADSRLRSALAVYDLARLEKLGAVRSSVFVYFEWFLRDAYGVKLLPSAPFTQGLIARGVISLGFG